MNGKEEKIEKEEMRHKPKMLQYLLLPALFAVMFSSILGSYIQNEWTQTIVKKQYFPNITDGFSECDHVNTTVEDSDRYKKVQQVTAQWQTTFTVADCVPTAISVLILPSYMDAYGRKFLLILSTAGTLIKLTTMCLTIHFEGSFWFVVSGHIVCGMTGSAFGFMSAVFSMVADLTPAGKKRTFAIVISEAIIMISLVLASFFSGFMIETMDIGFFKTSLAAACLVMVALLTAIVIPESLNKENRSPPQPVLKTLKRVGDFYTSSKEFKGKRKLYILLLISFGLATMSGVNRMGLETIYFLGKPFCWGPSKIGFFSMIRTGAQAFVGLVSVKILFMCMSGETVAILSTISSTASYIIEAFATSTVAIYMVPVAGIFSSLAMPMIRTIMSTMTPLERQGALYSSITLLEVVCTVLASISQNVVYSYTYSFLNGFVFLVLALVSVINLLLIIAVRYVKRKDIANSGAEDIEKEIKTANVKEETKL